MIIILTQCFPPTIGGIENLLENLSIELSKTYKVLVLADDHDKKNDNYYDSKHDTNLVIKRISGIKFFRKNLGIRRVFFRIKYVFFKNISIYYKI